MRQGRVIPLSKEKYHDIFRKFGIDGQEGAYAMEGKTGEILIDVSKLKPHPRNAEIYGEEAVSDLIVQIEAYGGIADPLKIKEDFTIISGHRRWQAACELGMTEVPCQIVSYSSEEEELAALVMLNYHRAKTNEQRAREGMVLEQALKAEGMERKLKALKQNQTDRDPGSLSAESEEVSDPLNDTDEGGKKGRTRDLVADAVNISSGKNFERMKKVIVAADKLKAEGKPDDATFLLQMLEKSVKPTSNLVDAGYASLPDEERGRIRSGGKEAVSQFINERLSKPSSKKPFKTLLASLNSAEQVLSEVPKAIDSLNADEVAELMESLGTIKSALETVTARLNKQEKKLAE